MYEKLVFASNNAHKLEEVRALFSGRLEVVSLADIGCHEEIPETADNPGGECSHQHVTSGSATASIALPMIRGSRSRLLTELLESTPHASQGSILPSKRM